MIQKILLKIMSKILEMKNLHKQHNLMRMVICLLILMGNQFQILASWVKMVNLYQNLVINLAMDLNMIKMAQKAILNIRSKNLVMHHFHKQFSLMIMVKCKLESMVNQYQGLNSQVKMVNFYMDLMVNLTIDLKTEKMIYITIIKIRIIILKMNHFHK